MSDASSSPAQQPLIGKLPGKLWRYGSTIRHKGGRHALGAALLTGSLNVMPLVSAQAQQDVVAPRNVVQESSLSDLGEAAPPDSIVDEVSQRRIVHADVVALDQLLVYNRFGSFNPYGMIFALRRDVQPLTASGPRPSADECAARDGTSPGFGSLQAGTVRIRDCKRPRPLVLRANAGDILEVTVTNLLRQPPAPDISQTWCGTPQPNVGTPPTRADEREAFKQQCQKQSSEKPAFGDEPADWPATRTLSFVLPGLEPLPARQPDGTEVLHKACLGLDAVPPNGRFTCRWRLEREGTHLFSSLAAPAGGEGDGGSLIQGLFGAVLVEPEGSVALRSQVTRAAFDRVWAPRVPGTGDTTATQGADERAPGFVRHARADGVRYDAASIRFDRSRRLPSDALQCSEAAVRGFDRIPILRMTRGCEGAERVGDVTYRKAEIVHGDLNAIIIPPLPSETSEAALVGEDARMQAFLKKDAAKPFREFTAIFHDELKTFYADAFQELDQFGQLSGIRDGFAINYGASGLGTMLLANRKGIGPTAACPECQYEEFFFESWASGDPALLEAYPDDPSNVHHSYLNDKVVFRNLHAGKETHVFHLHTHQWFAGNDQNRGSYLDSQTIGPQQGFTYRIYQGGLDRHAPAGATPAGWWETAQGSGNRNRTVGDAIFHCHLYPHLAQGMWELWRVHDALEDGTRVLPDGQVTPGISVARNVNPKQRRLGSVDPVTGTWRGTGEREGTPIPGLIPIPGEAAPTLPTYTSPLLAGETPADASARADGMPGFPFYIAGRPGHRPPQPPLDMAFDASTSRLLDGGLPRHVVTGGMALPNVLTSAERLAVAGGAPPPDGLVARMLALGDATSEYESLVLELLPHEGTPLERNAMAFHHDGNRRDASGPGVAVNVRDALGAVVPQTAGSYKVPRLPQSPLTPSPVAPGVGWFSVNGAPPAPGAPYADPCGAASGLAGTPYRRFLPAAGGDTPAGSFAQQTFTLVQDLLVQGDPHVANLGQMVPDPGLTGFRRFDVSAVQIDMVVNRAGWHDPQARIAVLTPAALDLKRPRGGVTKTARAEPFFYRAFSGECIELRHTNELPKDLELDDFQLRLPTDTIGQHIHLVKFDVTSADGSGNGFNYEDGTFAADEILARICAAANNVVGTAGERRVASRQSECADVATARAAYHAAVASGSRERIAQARDAVHEAQLWWRPRDATSGKYFQTTVQRWFADPVLSNTGDGKAADRTLRTVFSHDHFAPSNIQQHGYYTALMIEPQGSSFCVNGPVEDATTAVQCAQGLTAAATVSQPAPWNGTGAPLLALGDQRHVGTRATVFGPAGDALHPDTREFALAIADFALLYDGAPQDRTAFQADTQPGDVAGTEHKGLARLVGEAECRSAGGDLRDADLDPAELIPARAAPLCSGSIPSSSGTPVSAHVGQVAALRQHAEAWREEHGRPIAPPPRPEAITQKHHNPYLVNYRNEPVPLRLGARNEAGDPALAFASNPCVVADESMRPNRRNHRDVRRQRAGEEGDTSNVFRTAWNDDWLKGHGDPCTPVMDAVQGDRVQFRIIQGAHEVQHMFTVEGRPFRRNLDQTYPAAITGTAAAPGRDLHSQCFAAARALPWRPRDYDSFLRGDLVALGDWPKIGAALAQCENIEGYTGAQEIGISEHFEVSSVFRQDSQTFLRMVRGGLDRTGAPQVRNAPAVRGLQDALPQSAERLPPDLLRRLFRPGPDSRLVLPPGFRDPEPAAPADPRSGEVPLADYLVHFGSLDALWNGAWGLLRVHARVDAPTDVTGCLATRQATSGERVLPAHCRMQLRDGALKDLSMRLPDINPADVAGIPLKAAACPVEAGPPVRAVLVARRLGRIAYDLVPPLTDPDALAFVTLQEKDLPADVFKVLFENQPDPETVSSLIRKAPAELLPVITEAAVKMAAHPRLIRVNAGGCLELAIVNGLPLDMSDHRGDAPMPRIVPLNVDRDRSGPGPTGNPDDPGYRLPGVSARGQLRPSSNLAVSVAMPGLDRNQATPLPYGVNGTGALRPGEAAVLRLYAGRVGIGLHGSNYTPYAFGPVVVRSVSDPFNHGPHGLFAVIVVEPEGTSVVVEEPVAGRPGTILSMPGVPDKPGNVLVREHLLVFQDGLNLHAPVPTSLDLPVLPLGGESAGNPVAQPSVAAAQSKPVPNCHVCDDSYDYGEKGVSYRSAPFTLRLAGQGGVPALLGHYEQPTYPQSTANLNRYLFSPNFFTEAFRSIPTPLLEVKPDEQVMIRVVHPGGRARQRSFSLLGAAYDDIFPGFGSSHSGLLGPGKSVTAGLCAPRTAEDYLWRDGPQHVFAGGAWGMLRVRGGNVAGATACGGLP